MLPIIEQAKNDTIIEASPELIIQKIQDLRKHQRGIQNSIERYEKQLLDLFDARQTDRLEIEAGTLVRVKQGDGVYKCYIEL